MKTLSKEAEQQIVDAVKTALVMVDDEGFTPNAAIEKVARAEQWGPDMVRFASYAYNTGRQTAQREQHSDILAKIASFPLADPEQIIASIYPGEKKAEANSDEVSDEYLKNPNWLLRKAAAETEIAARAVGMNKAAAERPAASDEPWHVKASVRQEKVGATFKLATEARRKAAAAYDTLTNAMGELTRYFRAAPATRISYAAFSKVAAAQYGEQGTALCDWLYKAAKLTEPLTQGRVSLLDASQPPFDQLAKCIKIAGDVLSARDAHEKLAADLEADRRALAQALAPEAAPQEAGLLDPFVDGRSQTHAPPAGELKTAGILDGMIGASAAGATRSGFDSILGKSPMNSQLLQLESPDHDAQLRSIRTQAMLADLMGNDEIIKSYPHEQVLAAYNDIAQLAPRTATQPVAMRALLRKHLQNATEPFEVKEITDLEKGIKDTHDAPYQVQQNPGSGNKGTAKNEKQTSTV